ncbi:hypothetical protein A0O21_04010 [Streptococcus pantholopis]|uniref:Uncharacterized protein n=1 Tax=Streptococcus pantholopis TaxID=1811193 RepID=A0A172Q734_9STRE|nr:hypothetical protein A0O21_04010 [Streptococcus pantholopis]
MPERLERCGLLSRKQSFQTFTAGGKPEISDFVCEPLPERLGRAVKIPTPSCIRPGQAWEREPSSCFI